MLPNWPNPRPSRRRRKPKNLVFGGRAWTQLAAAVVVAIFALACLGLAVSHGLISFPNGHADALADDGLRSGLVVLALLVSLGLYAWAWRRFKEKLPADDQVFDPDIRWLLDLQERISTLIMTVDTRGVLAFMDILVNPEQYRIRVNEMIEFAERGLIQQVSIELSLPTRITNSAKTVYVPLLIPLKGELQDNFRLYDASGRSLPNLTYEETSDLAGVGLRYLLSTQLESGEERPATAGAELRTSEAGGAVSTQTGGTLPQGAAVEVDRDFRPAELAFLELIARRGRIDAADAKKDIDNIVQAMNVQVSEKTSQRLEAYLTLLAVSYPIAIMVSAENVKAERGRVLVKYERMIIPRSERRGIEGRLRLALGLHPHQVTVPVSLAASSRSYHLRINGPPDMYVIRQYLMCSHCSRLARRTWVRREPNEESACLHKDAPGRKLTRPIHFRLQRRRGQSFIHLYMTGYSKDFAPGDLNLLARFMEVPPGSVASASATALVTTLLIIVAGYVSTHSTGTVFSDLPALILALPVAAASWLGITEDSGKLVGSSLSGRLSLIFSGLLSVASIIAYLVLSPEYASENARTVHLRAPDIFGTASFGILGVRNWLWSVLIALSFLNLGYIFFQMMIRSTYYNYLRRKPGAEVQGYRS